MSQHRIPLSLAAIVSATLLSAGIASAQASTTQQAPSAPKAQSAAPATTAQQGQAAAAITARAARRQALRAAQRVQRPLAGRLAGVPWARLNLTDAQRDQLKQIQAQQATDAQAVRERLRTARQQLREAMQADVPDEGAVRTAAEAVGAAQAEQSVLQARLKGQRMQVLTPEQLQQLKDARARVADRQRNLRQSTARGWRR